MYDEAHKAIWASINRDGAEVHLKWSPANARRLRMHCDKYKRNTYWANDINLPGKILWIVTVTLPSGINQMRSNSSNTWASNSRNARRMKIHEESFHAIHASIAERGSVAYVKRTPANLQRLRVHCDEYKNNTFRANDSDNAKKARWIVVARPTKGKS